MKRFSLKSRTVGKKRLTIAALGLSLLMCAGVLVCGGDFVAEAVYTGDPDSTLFDDYEQMVDRLEHIESVSDGQLELEVIGQSNEGRDIYMATIGGGDVPVFIFTQQHGNEPHGTQSVLNLLEDLTTTEDPVMLHILEQLTIHIVPRLNPDGSEPGVFTRRNVDPLAPPGNTTYGRYSNYREGWDLNRYHVYNWEEHPLSEYEEFAIMTDAFGLMLGRTFNGSVDHAGEQGVLVDCGKGMEPEDFPPEVAGNIALVERNGTFNDKGANAEAAGAIGFVLYQEDPGATIIPRLTMSSPPDIPATVISRQSALEIINHPGDVVGQFVTYSYPESPATESNVLLEVVAEIEPLWLIDVHNQGSYISPDEKAVTSSVMWGYHEDVCPDASILGKQICVAMTEIMEDYEYAEVTQYPTSTSPVPFTASQQYAIQGVGSVLLEIWNNYTHPRIAEALVDHCYQQLFTVLEKTANETLYDINPDKAYDIKLRGESTSRANATLMVEPLLPVDQSELEEAIQDAIAAIDGIPPTLTMEDVMEVRIPRALVETALFLGAGETDIPNLSDLEEAEETIRALYDDNYMRHSYADLPVPLPEHEAAYNLFITRAERWWEGGHYVNGMTWLPLGSVSTSYSRVGDTYPDGRWVEYDISDRGFTRVKFYAGIADLSSRTEYPLTFQVHGDGTLLEEKILEYGEYAQFFLVDIEDVDMIRFSYYAHEGVDDDRANELVFVEPQFLIPINDAMLDAIDAAEAAIDALPDHISLLDVPEVKEARALVDAAVELGVELERPRPAHVEGSVYQNRIEGLPELVAAEETITDLYHHYYEQQSLHVLGDPGSNHRNSGWLIDFDNPERWEVHTEKWEDRGFVNFRGFAPLKVFTAGLSAIEHGSIYAEWDISEMDYDYIEGYFGLSDACTGGARFPVDFRIYGDGHLLFESHIRYGADAAFYRLDVEDVTWLRFEYSAEHVSSSGFAGWQVFVEPMFHHSPNKETAIAEAEAAIDALPPYSELTPEDEDDVGAARALINNALAIGVQEGDIAHLLSYFEDEPPFDILYGDINGDGVINVEDVIMVMQQVLGLIQFDEDQQLAADVNGDETINVEDVVLIMQRVLGLITQFPVED